MAAYHLSRSNSFTAEIIQDDGQRRLNTASVVQLRNVPASKEKINAMRTVLLAFTLIVAMGVTGVVATEAGVYVGETWLTCTRC